MSIRKKTKSSELELDEEEAVRAAEVSVDEKLDELAEKLPKVITCEIGHNQPKAAPSGWTPADWPTWPDEVTYNATGYGSVHVCRVDL